MCYLVFSAVFSIWLQIAISAPQLSVDQIKEITQKMYSTCQTKEGASDADVDAIKERQIPQTHEGLCMLECVMDMGKIMTDGKFNGDGMIAAFSPLLEENSTAFGKIKDTAKACDKEIVNSEDRCVNAKLAIECMLKFEKDFGFEIPKHD